LLGSGLKEPVGTGKNKMSSHWRDQKKLEGGFRDKEGRPSIIGDQGRKNLEGTSARNGGALFGSPRVGGGPKNVSQKKKGRID